MQMSRPFHSPLPASCPIARNDPRVIKHLIDPKRLLRVGIGPSLVDCFRPREEGGFAASGGGPVIIALGSLENE